MLREPLGSLAGATGQLRGGLASSAFSGALLTSSASQLVCSDGTCNVPIAAIRHVRPTRRYLLLSKKEVRAMARSFTKHTRLDDC